MNNNKILKNMCYITDDEEWKDIPGFEGLYQASTHGRIRSLSYGGVPGKIQVLKQSININNGYLSTHLYSNGEAKTYNVHRLIAITFVPNPNNDTIVNHKDENKQNNHYTNLEWCDARYNVNYGTMIERMAKAKSIPVLCIEYGIIFPSSREASRILMVDHSRINKSCVDNNTSVYGYHFRYLTEEELNIYNNSNKNIFKIYDNNLSADFAIQNYFARYRNIPIFCISNNTIYTNAKEASNTLNLSRNSIVKCCTGTYKNTGGYQFRYLTVEETFNYMRQLGNINMCTIIK